MASERHIDPMVIELLPVPTCPALDSIGVGLFALMPWSPHTVHAQPDMLKACQEFEWPARAIHAGTQAL